MKNVRFPKISANVDEATVTTWLKQEGESVDKGEMLLEVATDKGVIEVESPVSGTVRRLVVPENSTLPVGYIIALVGDPDEPLTDVTEANRRLLEEHRENAAKREAGARRQVRKRKKSRVRATPAARRMAREQNIDLNDVADHTQADIVNQEILEAYLSEKGLES